MTVQDANLLLLAFLRAQDVRGDLEPGFKLRSEPLQLLRGACNCKIVSMDCQRDVSARVVEVARATLAYFEGGLDEKICECFAKFWAASRVP